MFREFISYRRDDTEREAADVYETLNARFPGEVYLDQGELADGDDFEQEIFSALKSARVVIIVIGPLWATIKDGSGKPRIQNSKDVLRREVETALEDRSKTVIPVLVKE